MMESDRAELFAALAELAQRYPHWRIGQLVANVAGWADAEIWDAEDEHLLIAARSHLNEPPERSARPNSAASPDTSGVPAR